MYDGREDLAEDWVSSEEPDEGLRRVELAGAPDTGERIVDVSKTSEDITFSESVSRFRNASTTPATFSARLWEKCRVSIVRAFDAIASLTSSTSNDHRESNAAREGRSVIASSKSFSIAISLFNIRESMSAIVSSVEKGVKQVVRVTLSGSELYQGVYIWPYL